MSNKDLQDILSKSDKQISKTTNALARLYRTVLKDHLVGYDQFSKSINGYLTREQTNAPRSKKDQSREKGNLVKELSQNSFTFKNFTKGLRVLNPITAELTITLKWRRGISSSHSVIMNIQDPNDPDNKDE